MVLEAADGVKVPFQKDAAENEKKITNHYHPRFKVSRTIQRKVKAMGLEDKTPIHRPNPF